MPSTSDSRGPGRAAFVTGGSGFVGARLIRHLIEEGWRVRALARSPEASATVSALGAEPVRGDLDASLPLREGLEGCEVVFHVAAHFKLWGPRATFDRVNVAGTRTLVEAALSTPSVRRVIGVGAAAVVMGDPEPMLRAHEGLPLHDRRYAPYSASKAEGERVLLAANGRRPGFETIALRPPFIWGAGMPTLDHMIETVRAGRWRWVDGGVQAMSTCHVDNLCAALLLAADRGRGGEAYFVADERDGTLKGVITALLGTHGVNPGSKAVHFRAAWTIAWFMGAAWRTLRLRGEPPITRQMLRLIGMPFTVSTAKIRAEMGYEPSVSWDVGLDEMRTVPLAAAQSIPAVATTRPVRA